MDRPPTPVIHIWAIAGALALIPLAFAKVAKLPTSALTFREDHCLDCHDSSEQKGDLDLESLGFDRQHADSNFGRQLQTRTAHRIRSRPELPFAKPVRQHAATNGNRDRKIRHIHWHSPWIGFCISGNRTLVHGTPR